MKSQKVKKSKSQNTGGAGDVMAIAGRDCLAATRRGALDGSPVALGGLDLLLRIHFRIVSNTIRQAARERPYKIAVTGFSIVLIWIGMYVMLVETFHIVNKP